MNEKIMRAVLKKVKRSKRGCTLNDFSDWFPEYRSFRDSFGAGSGIYHPPDDLRTLVEWGLIDAYDEHRNHLLKPDEMTDDAIPDLSFYFSEFAMKLEDVLETSLTASPFFGSPLREAPKHDLFMIMPFERQLEPVFYTHVRNVTSSLSLTAARADVFLSSEQIMRDIWSGIYYARIIMADCTGRNPNVLYEIGIAHTLGIETLLISQRSEDIPFDLGQIRHIIYDYTPDGMADFETQLKTVLERLLSN